MKDTAVQTQLKCYHCGEEVIDHSITSEDKHFCCHGCKTVYELLDKNDLCDYYSLEQAPGTQLKDFFSEKYRFLENQDIAKLLLDFESEKFQKTTLHIPAIHCSSCIWLLENLQRFDEGIINSQINFSRKKLTVNLNPQITSLKKIVDLLCQLGYEPEINLEQKPDQVKKTTAPILKLGVAGFVFGNIMLLYFPEYLGLEVSSDFQWYFTYISLVLSIPVVVYCASDFYSSAIKALSKGLLNIDLPITIGVIALFARSLFEILSQTGPGYLDSLAGLIFFLLIGRWFQQKTYEGMSFERNYKSYFPLAVTRLKGDSTENVLVKNIVKNDILEIRNEEIIPCDSTLQSQSAHIDYSFVTGESDPVEVNRGDFIYAGGRVKGPNAKFIVEKEVSNSYLTQLWNDPETRTDNDSQFNSLIDQVSQYFTPVILGIAFLAGAYWFFVDINQALLVFSSVLIIACPCALALASPFTLNAVMNALGRHKLYLKNTSIIEDLWRIKRIIFDKTGTITSTKENGIQLHGNLDAEQKLIIGHVAAQSTHPLSMLIASQWNDNSINAVIEDYKEIKGKGIRATINEIVVIIGSDNFVPGAQKTIKSDTAVHININGEYKGYLKIANAYRPGVKSAIKELSGKYQLALLSGDNDGEKEHIESIFPIGSDLRFMQSPTDKLEYINGHQDETPTLMIGDGLNDAGALYAANVGISVTEDMASFTPASKAIVHGQQLHQLPAFLKLIMQSRRVIIAGFILSFLYNFIGISFAVMGWVSPIFAAILMPISSISVVLFSTLTIQFLASNLKTKSA